MMVWGPLGRGQIRGRGPTRPPRGTRACSQEIRPGAPPPPPREEEQTENTKGTETERRLIGLFRGTVPGLGGIPGTGQGWGSGH